MRKLASIRKIAEINPIENADAIEVATVDGWKVVVKKDEFKVGDLAVYLEVDSWVPTELAPFLTKGKEPREFNGVKGERLRTIKLRGQISQGLVLPLGTAENTAFPEIWQYLWDHNLDETSPYEADFSELLGIQKWERPIPAQLAGLMKGSFPSFIPKTDQERCISSGTLIKTDKGDVPIETICDNFVGFNVLTVNHDTGEVEYKPIIDSSIMTRRKGWVRIRTKSGNVIVVTTNHKIWLPELGAYREARFIKPGDKILSC